MSNSNNVYSLHQIAKNYLTILKIKVEEPFNYTDITGCVFASFYGKYVTVTCYLFNLRRYLNIMALVTITEASKLTGKSRKTIYSHLKKGKLSSSLQADGTKQIDTSELIRVYGEIKQFVTEVTPSSVTNDTPGNVTFNGVGELISAVNIMREQQELDRKENVLLRNQLLELTNTVKQLTNRLEYKPESVIKKKKTNNRALKKETDKATQITNKANTKTALADSSGNSNYLEIPVFGL